MFSPFFSLNFLLNPFLHALSHTPPFFTHLISLFLDVPLSHTLSLLIFSLCSRRKPFFASFFSSVLFSHDFVLSVLGFIAVSLLTPHSGWLVIDFHEMNNAANRLVAALSVPRYRNVKHINLEFACDVEDNHLEIVENGFVVQTGDPKGHVQGFIDPSTEKTRAIPLGIMVNGENAPLYGETLEEVGLYKAQMKLPFNAF
ncbi:unnamed protein product [Fraxinus pennsylvanica]|uniref:peptidylprolyl isomerase n=1 Tax=Fraxinus pennsylvanica TaxID=56036 RepID=A0AAD1YNX1_9LAMI|nr:unnamed protein product [Fraxinus pennsylvanica]